MHLQKYLPKYDDTSYPTPIPFVGDQLTCEWIRSAKQARVQSTTPHKRFEGIVELLQATAYTFSQLSLLAPNPGQGPVDWLKVTRLRCELIAISARPSPHFLARRELAETV